MSRLHHMQRGYSKVALTACRIGSYLLLQRSIKHGAYTNGRHHLASPHIRHPFQPSESALEWHGCNRRKERPVAQNRSTSKSVGQGVGRAGTKTRRHRTGRFPGLSLDLTARAKTGAFAIAASLLFPALAAACPVASDLAGGIRVTLEDDVVETYIAFRPGVVQHRVLPQNEDGSENLLANGIYTLQTLDIVDGAPRQGSRRVFTYPVDPSDTPLPAADITWAPSVVTFEGGQVTKENHKYVFGAASTLVIGDCSYDMRTITATFEGAPGYIETLYFLPDVGIALYGAYKDEQGSANYTFKKIEAIAQ